MGQTRGHCEQPERACEWSTKPFEGPDECTDVRNHQGRTSLAQDWSNTKVDTTNRIGSKKDSGRAAHNTEGTNTRK